MIKNGRQIGVTLDQIRDDHRLRYQLAINIAADNDLRTAVDIGTGIGYGAWMMADAGLDVDAYEIDPGAIAYGELHYKHHQLRRHQADIADLTIEPVDLLTGFEIVEHTDKAPAFLERSAGLAKWMVISVPNENVVPFETQKHWQHYRHYTPQQLAELIEQCGWELVALGSQKGKHRADALVDIGNFNGRTLVAVCRSSLCE